MKRKNGILTLIISFMILLTACGPGEKKSAKSGNNVDISKFPLKDSRRCDIKSSIGKRFSISGNFE